MKGEAPAINKAGLAAGLVRTGKLTATTLSSPPFPGMIGSKGAAPAINKAGLSYFARENNVHGPPSPNVRVEGGTEFESLIRLN